MNTPTTPAAQRLAAEVLALTAQYEHDRAADYVSALAAADITPLGQIADLATAIQNDELDPHAVYEAAAEIGTKVRDLATAAALLHATNALDLPAIIQNAWISGRPVAEIAKALSLTPRRVYTLLRRDWDAAWQVSRVDTDDSMRPIATGQQAASEPAPGLAGRLLAEHATPGAAGTGIVVHVWRAGEEGTAEDPAYTEARGSAEYRPGIDTL
ncbi:hypothetical protein [Streptomyces sp. URMC 129]|uniref:hypothetical protein n=1 Tax=Streptomyces sp. URMC 129 TaxID=3423407 RepID=UPI003F1DD853